MTAFPGVCKIWLLYDKYTLGPPCTDYAVCIVTYMYTTHPAATEEQVYLNAHTSPPGMQIMAAVFIPDITETCTYFRACTLAHM